MKPDLAPLFWLVLAGTCAAAAPTDLFVAPGGDDAAPGTAARPFATIQRAMQAVRALKLAETEAGPVSITLAGGTYPLSEPLVFGPEDSGTAASPITWRSAPGEQAVISGGRAIPGPWQPVAGKPYFQTKVPRRDGQPWRFNMLVVNGQTAERARTPNWGEKVSRAAGRAAGEDERQAFEYLPSDIDPTWTNLTDADIVLLCSWTPTIHRITEVDGARRVVRFHSSHGRSVDFWEKNFRYYVANVFEALDQPGEWYLNKQTETLYYYPRPGEDLATVEVIAPVMASRLVTIQGDVAGGRFVEHLRFENLAFKHLDGDLDKYNGMYRQGHMFLDSAIRAEGLRNSVFRGCELAQLGEYAMELGAGCRDNLVQQCQIHDIGAGALQLGLTDLQTLLNARTTPMAGDVVLEADQAKVVAPMVVEQRQDASGGACVLLPEGQQGGTCTFTVTVPEAGKYRLLAKVLAPSGQADSYVVQVNDGPQHTWDTGESRSWFVSPIVSRELEGKPLIAELRTGVNTIVIGGREPGTRLDQLLVRKDTGAVAETGARAEAEVLRNVIDNNVIHRLGTLWHGSYGIVNRFASYTKITHNDMFDMHWDAIGLDARWNWNGEDYSTGNEIAYNHLHHLGLGYHTDAGGVYQFGPLNTHIHHNVIHDTYAYPYICGYAGIYLDEQSRGALVENNLVYNLTWYAYFQHWGSDNIFRNNIGAFATHGMFGRGGVEDRKRYNQCEFSRNVYLTADDQPLKGAWVQGERPTIFRDNLVWSTTVGDQLMFAGLSRDAWIAKVQAENLQVADPGFRNPAAGDFTADPANAALRAIGFQPMDAELAKAGLYGDEAWTGLPDRSERRTRNPFWSPEDLLRFASFELDFEDMPDGYEPNELRLTKEGEATFAVTSEAACTGTKSLRCTDRQGLSKSFYPYVQLTSKRLEGRAITYRFDVMLDPKAPAPFYTEFRDREVPQAGPSLYFLADGTVTSAGKEILKAPLGTWIHVEIRFSLAAGAAREWTLVIGPEGAQQTLTLPYRSEEFQGISWLGIATIADLNGAFYLDNLSLKVD